MTTTGRCAECGRTDVPLADSVLQPHQAIQEGSGPWCPGHGDAPMRPEDVQRYQPTSQFRSCPAATGEQSLLAGKRPCTAFPDHAHRCHHERGPHRVHTCSDGYEWVTATWTDPT
jgi:hypothetical protein